MFTWINNQGVENNKGFIVQRTGRFTAEYRAGGRTLEFYVESGLSNGKPAILYSSAEFKKWSNDIVEQKTAEKNFCDAMRFQGLVPLDEQGTSQIV